VESGAEDPGTGTPVDAFTEVVVRSRAAVRTNPNAYRREAINRQDVLASRSIADPIILFQCTPNADGASAVVQRAAREAYLRAGVDPADIGIVELHDAFAPAGLTYLESLGLAEPGTAAERLLRDGFRGGSEVALNVGGGLSPGFIHRAQRASRK
jgi:acetyl-CoA acetyltransferase